MFVSEEGNRRAQSGRERIEREGETKRATRSREKRRDNDEGLLKFYIP